MRSRAASISLNEITQSQYTAQTAPAMVSRKIDKRRGFGGHRYRYSSTGRVENFADFGGELLGVERLRQKKHSFITPIMRMERFFEISGNENDFGVGAGEMEPIGKTASTHLRHDHVGQQELDLARASLRNESLSVIAIRSFDYLVAELAQETHGNVPHTHIIFEHENGFGSSSEFTKKRFLVRGRRRSRDAWEIDFDRCPFSQLAFDANISTI